MGAKLYIQGEIKMIGKNIKMTDCIGKYATLDHSIMNGAG